MTFRPRYVSISIAIAILILGSIFYRVIFAYFSSGALASPSENNQVGSFTGQEDGIDVSNDAIEPAGITTAVIESRDVPVTLTLTGRSQLNTDTSTHVQPQFAGKVVSITPKLGDFVKGPGEAGGPTILCVIESNDLAQAKSNWLQSRIQYKIDNDSLSRTRELYNANVLSEKSVIDAESAVIKDQAAVEAAHQQLLIFGLKEDEINDIEHQIGKQRMDYVITAPRSGVIAEKDVSGGEIAAPGGNLFVIADTKTLRVIGDVYEKDVSRIKSGQPMQAFFTFDPDHPRPSNINWISPVLDPNTHAVHIQGILDNSDGKILSDMYCTVVVTVDEGRNSLIVPADAIVQDGSNAFAFVQAVKHENTTVFHRVVVKVDPIDAGFAASPTASTAVSGLSASVTTGIPAGSYLRVTEGLHAGDVIVTGGALGLYTEMKQQAMTK